VASFLGGVKRPGREVDYSPSGSVEVKTTWIPIATLPIYLRGLVFSYVRLEVSLPFLYHARNIESIIVEKSIFGHYVAFTSFYHTEN
jgi:hypothetical protein